MPDLNAMAASVGALLKEKQHTIGIAESSCGGLISASLVVVAGASAFFLGGAVSYTGASRDGLLRIDESQMVGIRPSIEPYALLNARSIRDILGSTWALSETGASGPTGNRYGDSAGHACMAVVGPVEKVITIETNSPNREDNMWAFAVAAIDLLEGCLKEAS